VNPKKKNTQGTRLSLYCIPNTKIHNTFVHPPYNSYYKTHDSISKSSSCSRTHATTTKIPVAKTCGKDLQRSGSPLPARARSCNSNEACCCCCYRSRLYNACSCYKNSFLHFRPVHEFSNEGFAEEPCNKQEYGVLK